MEFKTEYDMLRDVAELHNRNDETFVAVSIDKYGKINTVMSGYKPLSLVAIGLLTADISKTCGLDIETVIDGISATAMKKYMYDAKLTNSN